MQLHSRSMSNCASPPQLPLIGLREKIKPIAINTTTPTKATSVSKNVIFGHLE
ncbi:hypothetical protein VCHA34P112_90167 [Vibrio chagasii]|nr:hypothetical protein VCHA34P112_90167 [Vibrio chagasii]CAH7192543.1 hypothetical protein VCHA55P509_20438 [Vibrio chagasii]CAH7201618.1 hypothetical protein VCHA54O485_20439 [Vibrio chagasii]CAH7426690.1 hypothetical protein VCHA54P501_20439 [Vibrio chagasii]CAH7428805.1 hypothetical protein VCHA56P515_90027 [Vibrio chagasii]